MCFVLGGFQLYFISLFLLFNNLCSLSPLDMTEEGGGRTRNGWREGWREESEKYRIR